MTPYNIMIKNNGGVKLCNFSESNYNNSKFDEITILLHKFRSPEKRPGEMANFKSDIYEVGMILDELTVKDISEITAEEWFERQIIISEKKNDSDINNLIRKMIKRAIQSDPDERYSSEEEMRNELEAVLEQLEGEEDVYQYLAAYK